MQDRDEELYEQISGGWVREVRSNVTLPAGESSLAVEGVMSTSLPSWKGFPQPAGGFPLPLDNGCFARQYVPSILAHWMPQCVYRRYVVPACARAVVCVDELACEPQPMTARAATTEAIWRVVIRSHYGSENGSSRGGWLWRRMPVTWGATDLRRSRGAVRSAAGRAERVPRYQREMPAAAGKRNRGSFGSCQERGVATRSRLPSGSSRWHSRPARPSSSTGTLNSFDTASMSSTYR